VDVSGQRHSSVPLTYVGQGSPRAGEMQVNEWGVGQTQIFTDIGRLKITGGVRCGLRLTSADPLVAGFSSPGDGAR
jgi:hypothetical protein